MADVAADPSRRVTFGEGEHPTFTNGEGPTKTLKKKSSLRANGTKRQGGSVSFHETVTVRELPSEEAEDAKSTRKGGWDEAPEHDELWDGHTKDFWEEEKSIEEVRRIVVVRQMRMALEYNLGYAFYAMVANFKKRRPTADDGIRAIGFDDDDVVPQFETPGAEETSIRKEIRELFADSVKGLDFPDLVQDREAFDKLYATTIINISEARRVPGLGLLRIEELVDEIMNTEEICRMLGVQYVRQELPAKGKAELAAQEKIESAVGAEEKRRGERRASIEAHNGIPAFGERRASIEARRRTSIDPMGQSPLVGRRGSMDPRSETPPISEAARRESIQSDISARRLSIESSGRGSNLGLVPERRPSMDPVRRGSISSDKTSQSAVSETSRRSSIQPEILPSSSIPARRPSIQEPRRSNLQASQINSGSGNNSPSTERRTSFQPLVDEVKNEDDDQPIFASSNRGALRGGRLNIPVHPRFAEPVPSIGSTDQSEEAIVRIPYRPSDYRIVNFGRVALGLFILALIECQRSFHVTSAIEFGRSVKAAGPSAIVIPLLIILGLSQVHLLKS